MARTEKQPELIKLLELQRAVARLRLVIDTIENAVSSIATSGCIAVVYGKSLERGIEALETFEPELKRSVAMFQAGIPLEVQVSNKETQAAEAIAESEASMANVAAKAKAKPQSANTTQTRKPKVR